MMCKLKLRWIREGIMMLKERVDGKGQYDVEIKGRMD